MTKIVVIVEDFQDNGKCNYDSIESINSLVTNLYEYYCNEHKKLECKFVIVTRKDNNEIYNGGYIETHIGIDEKGKKVNGLDIQIKYCEFDKDGTDISYKIKELKGDNINVAVLLDVLLSPEDMELLDSGKENLIVSNICIQLYAEKIRCYLYTGGRDIPKIVTSINRQYSSATQSVEKLRIYHRREIDGSLGFNYGLADALITD